MEAKAPDQGLPSSKAVINPWMAAFAIASVICFNFPAVIYHANADDIDSSFAFLSLTLAPICFALTALLAAPSLFLKTKAKQIYSGCLAAIAILIWITGTFLVFQHALLNGSDTLRPDSGFYQRIESIVLLVSFSLLILIAYKAAKLIQLLIFGLIFMNIGMLAFGIATDRKSSRISGKATPLYEVSSKKNVFVFLFDAFLSDLFEDVLKKHPEFVREFDGFTYFSKATGVAPTTYLSLPAIHSGIPYTEGLSLKTYYQIGIRNGSFLSRLASAGYNAAGVNFVKVAPLKLQSFRATEIGEGVWRSALKDALLLFDISLYRAVPSIFKQRIYHEGDWLTTRFFLESTLATESNRFLDLVGKNFHPAYQQPCVRWIHLYNTHPPASVDADCKVVPHLPWNKQNAENQDECAVRHIVGTLNEFKKNKIYDNSLIVLIADHGIGFSINRRPEMLGSAHPIFLVKPIGKHGPLAISEARVFLTDVPKTVCALSESCDFPNGVSAFDPALSGSERTITFNDYEWRNQYWGLAQLPISSSYLIKGPEDDILSWYKKIPENRIKTLHLNFDTRDDPEIFGFGWSRPEKTKRPARAVIAPNAQLYLPLPQEKDATVDIRLRTHPKNENQKVTLYLDANRIDTKSVPAGVDATLTFEIPGRYVSNPLSRLTFRFNQIFERGHVKTNREDVSAIAARFFELTVR